VTHTTAREEALGVDAYLVKREKTIKQLLAKVQDLLD